MSPTPPPADLRARVLAAAGAQPVATRKQGVGRATLALVLGFGVTLGILLYIGGPSADGRPMPYMALIVATWVPIGLLATWGGVSRGRAMLGRSAGARAMVILATPAALLFAALVAGYAWPETLEDDATLHSHLLCVTVTLLSALGPLAAFAILRRASDPVAPRLTGAAIGAASGAWGALAIELRCGHSSLSHIALGHVLPIAALTLLGVLIGDRVVAIHARSAER